ncbi:uncharacterized protein CXorf38 homolog isoform X2 [Ranitomeya imitator]|uniref:uncharacterized protein CXorf38 homolog isoform X2 n=1 Tax=Ranitomeya imitator TaxID=111125 RepID=UPI0037E7717D
MALHGLHARLNCTEYKNWMKAGHCLLLLQNPLQEYITLEMQTFHQQLTDRITVPKQRRCRCRAKGKQFEPKCPVCTEWQELILSHHNNKNGDIYWGNSDPSLWSTHYWEVANVYMPCGQAMNGPQQCDAASLLNLINNCDHFRVSNILRVKEVIKCRNELMHSFDMKVSFSWLKAFGEKMHDLITDFSHVPGLVREGQKMKEVLLLDWTVDEPVTEAVQSKILTPQKPSSTKDDNLSRYTVLMIQQMIQELYLEIEQKGSALTKKEEVDNNKNFLCQNNDLNMFGQGDLKKLETLKETHFPFNDEEFAADCARR